MVAAKIVPNSLYFGDNEMEGSKAVPRDAQEHVDLEAADQPGSTRVDLNKANNPSRQNACTYQRTLTDFEATQATGHQTVAAEQAETRQRCLAARDRGVPGMTRLIALTPLLQDVEKQRENPNNYMP
ncbi:MAG: hypothetical protein M1829_006252 [Trizodia sp. TS-e1964]|nr:MAG: hypothetical protein M1829_006252 [Trizodia sp. TS-e1964]